MKHTNLLLLMIAAAGAVPAASAQTTAFSYQGQLDNGGVPANGSYDLRFNLWDTATGGNILAALTNAPIGMTNGRFTVQLDFGANVFDGSARWLEIGVRTNGSAAAYTDLTPRQLFTAAPYAIQSVRAGSAATASSANAVAAANILGTIADGQLSANVALLSGNANFAGTLTAANFGGNGANLTNVLLSSLMRPNASPVLVWGNTYTTTNVPSDATNIIAIARGVFQITALRANGTVMVWGDNSFGQTNVPAGLSNVVALASGPCTHCVALKSDGTVVVWGHSGNGEANVPAGLSAKAIGSGWYHVLAVRTDGTVAAWGFNNAGQCNVPAGLSNVVAVSGGAYNSVALKSDGTVVTWGENLIGNPMPAGLTNAVQIASGEFHLLALKSDGTVAAWGYNSVGQSDVPTGLSNVVAIAAGEDLSAALKADGVIVTWGKTNNVRVSSGVKATAIAAGGQSIMALANTFQPPPFVMNQDTAVTLGGTFVGNGAGLTNLATGNLTGLLPDVRLSSNIPRLNGTNPFTGPNTFLGTTFATNAGNRFAGAFAGDGTGLSNINAALFNGLNSGAFGLLAGTNNWAGTNTFLGTTVATNAGSRFAGAFTGDGTGLSNINATLFNGLAAPAFAATSHTHDAANIVTGTLVDTRLSTNVDLLNSNQTITATKTFSPPTGAPFAVGSTAKIANLNADLLDGLDSGAFGLLAGTNNWTGTNYFGRVGIGTNYMNNTALQVVGNTRLVSSVGVGPQIPDWAEGRFHISGSIGELSISDRSATNFVNGPTNGERWIWYVSSGKMTLWSGANKATFDTNAWFTVSGNNSFSIMPGYRQATPDASTVTLDIPGTQTLLVWDNFEVTGNAYKPGGGSWSTSSDRRLKDLGAQFTRGLDAVMNLDPVHYHYKKDNLLGLPSDQEYIGVVAQQVKAAVPEAVSTDAKGFYLVNNDPILWTMLNAIKELKTENDSLKARLEKNNAQSAMLLKQMEEQQRAVEQIQTRLRLLENTLETVRKPNGTY